MSKITNILENKEILEQIALLKLSLLKEGINIDALGLRQKGEESFNVFNIPDFEGEL